MKNEKKNEKLRMNIKDLFNETGFRPRTIHHLVEVQRLPPVGRGRAGYGEEHLKALRELKFMQDVGVSRSDDYRRYILRPGIELHVKIHSLKELKKSETDILGILQVLSLMLPDKKTALVDNDKTN